MLPILVSLSPKKGEIQTHLNDQTYELGHHRIDHPTVTQIIDNPNLQSVLVIRAFSEGSITQALNPNKRQDLINELIQTAQENKFSGFNIDFEPPGDMSNFSSGLTEFTRELSDACRWQIPNCHMSIDVYASTPFNSRIWELRNLANHVDHIIIMGYDFYYSGSPNAGPPAPIYGSPDRWKYDLQNSINAFITQVPPKQLILGVPWYGYEWTTLSQTPGSVALGKGGTATYSRVQELLTQCPSLNCKINTDPDSLTPYIIYHKDGDSIQQIWYDDRLSLSYKYQLVRDWSLAGMAIWALGYEYPYTGLWEQFQTDLP